MNTTIDATSLRRAKSRKTGDEYFVRSYAGIIVQSNLLVFYRRP